MQFSGGERPIGNQHGCPEQFRERSPEDRYHGDEGDKSPSQDRDRHP